MTIDTACSGALICVDLAGRYLQTREISGAIVAGCNIYLSPEHVMDGLSTNGTASPSGLCHTFDLKADGYIKAEGVNMVYLKRLDDALRDGNPIRGIIRGTATGSNGWTPGIASPNSAAQAATIRQAYANAHISDLAATCE
jgi:acyl transferase domain-containing protein